MKHRDEEDGFPGSALEVPIHYWICYLLLKMYYWIERAEHISNSHPGEAISHVVTGYMCLMQLFAFLFMRNE